MKKSQPIRQGDILLVPVSKIPDGLKPVSPENGRLILARGEATGHHHSVIESTSTELLAGPNDAMYLMVKEGEALLEHQEHAVKVLPKCNYRVLRQVEFTPEALRNVAD